MSEKLQRRLALGLAVAAFAIASAALVVAIVRRGAPLVASEVTARPESLLDTIHKIDDTNVEVPRATLDEIARDPSKLSSGARALRTSGGFRLYLIRHGSLLERFGLENGDLVRGINGMDVPTPDRVLEIYNQLRSANRFTIDVDRRGTPMQISVAID
jgi:general secretion pathway protein C